MATSEQRNSVVVLKVCIKGRVVERNSACLRWKSTSDPVGIR